MEALAALALALLVIFFVGGLSLLAQWGRKNRGAEISLIVILLFVSFVTVAQGALTVWSDVIFGSGSSSELSASSAIVILLAGLVGLAFGAIGTAIAIRTGSSETVQGMFPLLFVAFFLSSMNLPRHLIEADWFRAIATLNPISYVIEALRSLVLVGWDAQALALGFACVLGIVAVALAGSAGAFRERMTRT